MCATHLPAAAADALSPPPGQLVWRVEEGVTPCCASHAHVALSSAARPLRVRDHRAFSVVSLSASQPLLQALDVLLGLRLGSTEARRRQLLMVRC